MIYSPARDIADSHDWEHGDLGSGRAAWRIEAIGQLERHAVNRATLSILRLGIRADNWDGYGSRAADHQSIVRAIAFVGWAIEIAADEALQWIEPHAGLNEEGHVSLEWWNGPRKLTIYISLDSFEYVSSWGTNIDTQMDAGEMPLEQFSGLYRWLNARPD